MKTKVLLYCLLCFLLMKNASAQDGFNGKENLTCGADDAMKDLLRKNPAYRSLNEQIEAQLAQFKKSGQRLNPQSVVTLPVVVHIIHNNGPENISDARVLAGIQHLNEAFANTGYYDPADGVNTNIQFCLAQRDPSGNLTGGITRDVSVYTNMGGAYYYSDDLNVKNINRWDPTKYINIWLVNSIPGSVAGYAYLPSAHGSNVDGIIEEAEFFGISNAKDVVIIHEMGHYLGLYHTFEGGCSNADCVTDGDKVCDTPPDNSTAFTSCSVHVNSCSTDILSGFSTDQDDLMEDYMDYGNWDCMSVFTQGQAERMNWHINFVRSSLLTSLSCQTPCSSPVTAAFNSTALTAVAGTTITFTNTSVNGAVYAWYVNGLLVSSSFNYTQQFTQQGIYSVKLITASGMPLQCSADEEIVTITITCPASAAISPAYNGVVQVGQSVAFTNNSINATSYEWFFDNALAASTPNYTAVFNNTGTHYIKLKANSQYCSDSFQVYYLVNPDIQSAGNASFQKHYERISTGIEELFNYSAVLTPEEDIVVAGAYNSTKNWVTKFTSMGDVIWSRRYENNNISRITASVNTNDGGYLFGGDHWLYTAFLIKVGPNGNILWNLQLEPATSNYAQHHLTDIIQLPDSSFIVATTMVISTLNNNTQIVLFKVSNSGVLLWTKTITGLTTEASKLYLLGNGVYVAGSVATPNASQWNGLLIKIDAASGNILFAKKYDAASRPNKLMNIASVGNKLVLNGYVIDPANSLFSNIKTIGLVDLNGNVIQSKEIQNANGNAISGTMLVNGANNILISVTDRTSGKIYLNKYDSSLQLLAGKKYLVNTNIVKVTNIFQLGSGNLILTGNRGDQHTLLIRTLADLTTPGCNDSSFTPSIINSSVNAADITSSLQALAGGFSFPASFTEQVWQVLPHTVCNYTPVAATCDSAMVQNYYAFPNAGISGTSSTVIKACKKNNGNILLACVEGFSNAVLMETDNNGNRISSRKFPGIDAIVDVKPTSDNGYVLLCTKSFGAEFYLLKFDASNTLQWSKEYDIDLWSGGFGTYVYQLSDNGYIVLARQYLVRLDAAGNYLFGKKYNAPFSSSIIGSLVEDGPDVVFNTLGGAVIKINKTTGNQVWGKEILAYQLIKMGTGYLATSFQDSDSTGTVIKINNSGNVTANTRIYIPGASFDKHSMINSGTALFTLRCNKKNFSIYNNNKIYLAAFDSSFNIISAAQSNGSFVMNGNDILYDGNGHIFTSGNAYNSATSLVNQYPILFKSKVTQLSNSCVFDANNPLVTPGLPLPADQSTDVTAQNVTVTVTNTTLPASGYDVFTNRLCVSDNCITTPVCDTTNCNMYSLGGVTGTCHLTDTVRIILTRGNGCTLSPSWSITGTAAYQVIAQNDSALTLLFTSAGISTIRTKSISACRVFEDSLSVTVGNAPATLNLGDDVQLCTNSVVTLHAGAGFQSYTWQDQSTDSTFTAYLPGTYYVTATDACGMIYKDTVNITLAAIPVFELGLDTTRCSNDSITLTAPAGFTNYTWGPNYNISSTTDQSITTWPGTDTIYTVTAVYNNSCIVLDSIKIFVRQVAAINAGNDTSFCQGGSALFNAGPGFLGYEWSTGATTQSINPSSVGQYHVAATDINGCIAKDTVRILNIYPNPAVNLGPDTSLCRNAVIVFNAGNGYTNYLWQDNSASQSFSASAVGLYWVQVKNQNNCIGRDSVKIISILPDPVIDLGHDTSFCTGQSVTFTPGTGFNSYLWQNNSTAPAFTASLPGWYWVQVTNSNNCKGKDSIQVLSLYPKPAVFLGNDASLCKGKTIILNAGNGFTTYTWQDNSTNTFYTAANAGLYWVEVTNSNGCVNRDSLSILTILDSPKNFIASPLEICKDQNNYIHLPGHSSYLWSTGSTADSALITQPGIYWLQVSDASGCKGTESFAVVDKYCITGVYFPNTFTPNGDHINAMFGPQVFGDVEQYQLAIYNRYGQQIFLSKDPQNGWDGRFKGAEQNLGVYVWICTYKLKAQNPQTQKGTVLLLR